MTSREKLSQIANDFYSETMPDYDTMQYFKDVDADLEVLEILKEKEIYKHWNIFYNGKTGQYLLYLYVDKKSVMLKIGRELYKKIKKIGS